MEVDDDEGFCSANPIAGVCLNGGFTLSLSNTAWPGRVVGQSCIAGFLVSSTTHTINNFHETSSGEISITDWDGRKWRTPWWEYSLVSYLVVRSEEDVTM